MNMRGDVLIYRDYKNDIKRGEFIRFSSHLLSAEGLNEDPIVYFKGVSYFWVKHHDLYLIASTKSNPNAGIVFQFLHSFIGICKGYFDGSFSHTIIKKNFVVIYELLDEIMDYGVPQITETELLKAYIQEGGTPKALNDLGIIN